MSSAGKRPITLPVKNCKNFTLLLLILLQAGDIEPNPGPRGKQATAFPCGLCETPVTWTCEGVCCECCNIWHHNSCIELCTEDYELLQKSNVQWICCKCESINVTSFTYHTYELDSSNYYEPLTYPESIMDSFTSTTAFNPIKTSSPKSHQNLSGIPSRHSSTNETTGPAMYNISNKKNLRILTVNCRSIRDKNVEFHVTLNYTKPDIVLGTESWLKGIKPGKNATKDAIKSCENFPDNYVYIYTVYRNDRGILGGGIFIMVNKDIISVEKTEFITNCEIEWVSIKLKNNKDLLIGCYYMPHRNSKDIEELERSLNLTLQGNNKNIMLRGDFNCPDIDWSTRHVKSKAHDIDVQKAVIDITTNIGMTQVHNEPTRENNLMDIIFTMNPSLIKSSTNIPGISDHAIIITDMETKPHYQKTTPRKGYIYSKANWNKVKEPTIPGKRTQDGIYQQGNLK